ncbi:c-type cytochrome [Hymenobacter guriensis]|nr:cytochrome c [Hymenobacter guriensis]
MMSSLRTPRSFLLTGLLGAALLAGCQGQEPGRQPNATVAAGQVLAPGQALYEQNCTPCHGSDDKRGLNGAHDLTKSNLNQAGRVYMVTNGLGNMPGFKNQLSPEQIEQVTAYSLSLK